MNKWIALGYLGRDPEIKTAQSGTTIARFSLAVARRFKKDGENNTDWFNCVAFGKTADFIGNYLHKGSKVVVEAEIQNDNYEKDGVKHYGVSMVINSIEFAESKAASQQNNGQAPTQQASSAPAPSPSDFMSIDSDIDAAGIPF